MVITIFGASGMVGKKIIAYALSKGNTVRAFGRNVTGLIDADLRSSSFEAIQGSVFESEDILRAVTGADLVLSALGGGVDGVDKTRSLGMKYITQQMQQAGVKRIVALGGSGVLSTPKGEYIIEQPGYPKEFLAVGKEHLQAYLVLNASSLDWTFVCSPTINDGDATGDFVTSSLYPPSPNKNYISAGDLANFMVDEAENPKYIKQRVGISAI
jgi:putative NADH-flavin reductase